MNRLSLRARLALAAGVAVALAVVAVAVSAYAGTRSELEGQVDNQLQSLAQPVLQRAGVAPAPPSNTRLLRGGQGPGAPGGGPGQGGQFGAGALPLRGPISGDPDEGLGLDQQFAPQAFGGPSGTFTLVKPDGTTYTPRQEKFSIPADARATALAKTGKGQYFTDMTVTGHHIRALVTGLRSFGALMVALPLNTIDHTLRSQLVLLVVIAAAGIALAALLGVLVARTALAPIARFTRQTEKIAANPEMLDRERLEVDRRRRARAARAHVQRHARRTRALGAVAAESRRRCLARAAHTDRDDPGEPPADAR